MSAAQHTPGPWRAQKVAYSRDPSSYWQVFGRHSRLVCQSIIVDDPSPDLETDEANARLIASAPELLVVANHPVLAWLLGDGLGQIPEPQRTSVRIFLKPLRDAALAKAEGRQ